MPRADDGDRQSVTFRQAPAAVQDNGRIGNLEQSRGVAHIILKDQLEPQFLAALVLGVDVHQVASPPNGFPEPGPDSRDAADTVRARLQHLDCRTQLVDQGPYHAWTDARQQGQGQHGIAFGGPCSWRGTVWH